MVQPGLVGQDIVEAKAPVFHRAENTRGGRNGQNDGRADQQHRIGKGAYPLRQLTRSLRTDDEVGVKTHAADVEGGHPYGIVTDRAIVGIVDHANGLDDLPGPHKVAGIADHRLVKALSESPFFSNDQEYRQNGDNQQGKPNKTHQVFIPKVKIHDSISPRPHGFFP